MQRVTAAYAAAGVPAQVAPFFADIPRRLAEAQLVVSRAGASSVADIAAVGRPAILIPYAAAAEDHQTANAAGLAAAGAATVIAEAELTAETLAAAITLVLGDPGRAQSMARAALAQGIPDAAERLAGLIEDVAGGRT
jgi:UDP-N-acetylglucosamine--N-acetylmuramyl-(pentapeptide) pyrophosphoryl-undecaprenol N-acetylglucosamine transferase